MNTETIIPVALKEFGRYVTVCNDTIFEAPMVLDDSVPPPSDLDDFGEVTHPASQKFLDAVNKIFGTHFNMRLFYGEEDWSELIAEIEDRQGDPLDQNLYL